MQVATLVTEHSTPRRMGHSRCVGVRWGAAHSSDFSSCSAFALAMSSASSRRCAPGDQISTPPSRPILLLDCQVGALLLRGHLLPLSVEAIRGSPRRSPPELFVLLLVGASSWAERSRCPWGG